MYEKYLKPKKSLGQNFLRSQKAIDEIVSAVKGDYEIIEIGGGEGVVTRALLDKGHTVRVIELDERAVAKMSGDLKDFINSGKLEILNQDVLESDFNKIVKTQKYIVVGNIPYYITGLIFRHIFEQEILPSQAILMVQKEVAERVVAKNSKESIISLSVKFYGHPKMISIVRAESFLPPPKVDSAIISIEDIIEKTESTKDLEIKFFILIKAAFKHPRKYALNNIKKYLIEDSKNKTLLESAVSYLDEKVRAEDVSLDTWLKIIKSL